MSEMQCVTADIFVGFFALVAEPLGRFRFASVPRVDELIIVIVEGEKQILTVKSITHQVTAANDHNNQPTVRLLCTKS